MADTSNLDWQAIRADYENGSPLRALATKYGVSKSVIGERKYKERWTERTDTRTKSNPQEVIHSDVNASVRAVTGFKLRFEQNKTWDDVAAGSGYASRGAARNGVLREAQRHISHNIEEIRDEELYRLDQLLMRCYKAGMDEKNDAWTWAIDRYNVLAKRKSELMGLDQSVKEAAIGNVVVIREVPQGLLVSE